MATGDYNWDAALFRIMPSIFDAKDVEERNQLLVNWINRLGRVKVNKIREEDTSGVTAWPDFSWMDNPDLGKTLPRKLNQIKNCKRNKDNYYLYYDSDTAMFPQFQLEKRYENLSFYDDSGMRLLALFRLWNIVQYFYPYRYMIEKEWDAALAEFIPKFLDGFTSLDYKQAIFELTNRLNDNLLLYRYLYMARPNWQSFYTSPYKFVTVENKLIVKEYFDKTLGQKSGLIPGDIILNINNTPVEKLIHPSEFILPLTTFFREGYIRTPESQIVTADIIRDGKRLTREVTNYNVLFFPDSMEKNHHSILSTDIGYIETKNLKIDSIPIIMKSLMDSKGLIIDARSYISEDSLFSVICSYLLPNPVEFAAFSRIDATQPGKFTLMPAQKVGKENPDYYKGKVVLLINEATFAHSEIFAMHVVPNVTIIGSEIISSYFYYTTIILLGNIYTLMTGTGLYTPDGRDMLYRGIQLDVELKPTLQGIIEGSDELIEKAIEIINESQ